ncbi:MAG TPA: hypothetical protein VJ915_01605 [Balneolaceae bacterium]|nr:hypothetical protein [Balneolaceae bacterium]
MKKENITVIDVSEFPDPLTDEFLFMPEEDEEEMDMYTEFIQLGTSVPKGTKIESDLYCRQEMDDGELCEGTIDVMQIDLPKQVRWTCRRCGDKGALVNYEGSVWDNSHLSDIEKAHFLESFFTDFEGEDYWEDDLFYDFFEGGMPGPLDDFEYYLNPYDPDGDYSGAPSSEQIREMLERNWLLPDSPVYLKDSLTIEEAEQSFLFYNARRFLMLLQKEGPFELTRTEQLKRRDVRGLLEEMHWPDGYIESIRSNKSGRLDESDVLLLHGIRVLLSVAGMVEEREGDDTESGGSKFIRFNEDRGNLLKEESAGELYRQLFSTYFKDMNLGYLGSSFEFPHLQHSIPFILYQLKDTARDWVPVDELLQDILLYSVKFELQFADGLGFDMDMDLDMDLDSDSDMDLSFGMARDFLQSDLFAPLERFALLETKSTSANPGTLYDSPDHVRVTELFHKFVKISG